MPKITPLKKGQSTYRTGEGGVCGGVVSQSTFDSEPWAYLMAYVMPDKWFEKYAKEKDEKKAKLLFDKYAKSMI